MENEKVIMEIIAYAGDARSKFLESITNAKDKRFVEAKQLFQQGSESLHVADTLSARVVDEGMDIPVSLLMVHSQDYLMNASTLKELAQIMNAFIEESSYD